MKRFSLLILCAFMLLFSRQSAASESFEATNQVLEHMAGTWYDEAGCAVLTIEGRTINGCEVVAMEDWVGGLASGGAKFRIREAGGECMRTGCEVGTREERAGGLASGADSRIREAYWERTLGIGWKIFGGAGDYIALTGGDALQRTLTPEYFESVGGVHFGMRMSAVQEILGEGKELTREQPCHAGGRSFSQGLYYPEKRLIVFREKGIVTGLVLLQGSNLRFDRSGLTANDSREAYARAYRLPQIPEESSRSGTASYRIAPGENISFGSNGSYVMLSIYNN